jgi:hypothetical protein
MKKMKSQLNSFCVQLDIVKSYLKKKIKFN